MTTVVTAADLRRSRAVARRAAGAVLGLDLRLIGVGALVLTVVVSGITAVVVLQYAVTFTDPQAAGSMQLLAENPAIRVLFGTPRALDTAGGFTVWRIGTFTAVAAAVWGLLAATRLTRGEEDAGRTTLLLTGPLTLARLQAQRLSLLLAVQAVMGVAIYPALTITGAGGPSAVVYGTVVALVGMVFTAVGALTGQLAGSWRGANELAVAALVASLLLRMAADGWEPAGALSWLTPFGLLSLTAPYAGDHTLPLLVLAATALVLSTVTVLLAGRRDVDAGLVPARRARRGRFLLLGSTGAFAARRVLPGLRSWGLGLVAYYGVIGLLAASLTDFLTANPRFAALAAAAGFAELTTVQGYVAALFFLLPVPLGLFAATQLGADAADEKQGRLTLLLAGPVSRPVWAAARLVAVITACCLLALLTGIATFLGTMLAGASLSLGQALAGAANAIPVALLAVAAGQLALGATTRAVVAAGTAPVVGGFVLWTLAGTFGWPAWIEALSPFTHLASVPAEPVDSASARTMTTIATLGILTGIIGFSHRDLKR